MARIINSGDQIQIDGSTILKARQKIGNNWSALRKINFMMDQQDFSSFKVTEIHYYPQDGSGNSSPNPGSSYEFIEFKNTSKSVSINLSGVQISAAINYTFPEECILPPNQYYVIASKPSSFYERNAQRASGFFKKKLSNDGEEIIITDATGTDIMVFSYDVKSPWPDLSNGQGFSIVSSEENPQGDPGYANYWTKSPKTHGTPFYHLEDPKKDNFTKRIPLDSDDVVIYPNPTSDDIIVKVHGDVEESYTIEIYNMVGHSMFKSVIFYEELSVSLKQIDLSYGVYILEVKSNTNVGSFRVIYLNTDGL